jgi:hypothetical protein
MAPLALVARPDVVSFLRAVYEQEISYLQTARTIPVPCGRKMILSGLFGGGEDNIRA